MDRDSAPEKHETQETVSVRLETPGIEYAEGLYEGYRQSVRDFAYLAALLVWVAMLAYAVVRMEKYQ
jgi:hypothetical protein